MKGRRFLTTCKIQHRLSRWGEKWLANEKQHVTKNSFEVSALELPEFDRFKVGDSYQFINPQVAKTAQLLQVVEKDIDFAHERNSSLKIADVAKSLTDYQIEDGKKINARFQSIQKTLAQQSLTIANLSSGAMSGIKIISHHSLLSFLIYLVFLLRLSVVQLSHT